MLESGRSDGNVACFQNGWILLLVRTLHYCKVLASKAMAFLAPCLLRTVSNMVVGLRKKLATPQALLATEAIDRGCLYSGSLCSVRAAPVLLLLTDKAIGQWTTECEAHFKAF